MVIEQPKRFDVTETNAKLDGQSGKMQCNRSQIA